MFFEKFKSFVKEQGLLKPEAKVLLTVSGGIDSLVMLNLFIRLKIHCSIAHCNFQLRGAESEADEQFVRRQAELLNVQIFVVKFETEEYAYENHLSIQMAARALRYAWFEKLAKVHGFCHIAVGHNLDDSVETFFINLGRGTGIAGLSGIAAKSGNIIRPLLFASRAEIEQYAIENNIPHREDSSNASDKYLRNYLRHNVVPQFRQVFPNFKESVARSLENMSEAHLVYKQAIGNQINVLTHKEGEDLFIDIEKLVTSIAPKTLLYESIKAYGFSSSIRDEIYQSLRSISGKQFFSTGYKLIKDRNYLIISRVEPDKKMVKAYIDVECKSLETPCKLSFNISERSVGFTFETDPSTAQLDFDKLTFPLILRKWQSGDYFMPLGMKGMKKLSDFFIDQKLSLIDKENTWLLTSNNHIAWVIGLRIDDRYKISQSTQCVYAVTAKFL